MPQQIGSSLQTVFPILSFLQMGYLFPDNTGVRGIGRDGGLLRHLARDKTLPSDQLRVDVPRG